MDTVKFVGQILWTTACAVAFIFLLASVSIAPSDPTNWVPSLIFRSQFAVGVGYFVVGLPPLYLLERGRAVSPTRYWATFVTSVVASLLAVIINATPPLPLAIAAILFPMYLSIGFWVIFITWFLWLTRTYSHVRTWHRVYAWVTTVGINGALLWWLLRFSVRM